MFVVIRIDSGSTGTEAGYLEIATADNGNEPIYTRQYKQDSPKVNKIKQHEIKLLDASGNTLFPGSLTASNIANDNETKLTNIKNILKEEKIVNWINVVSLGKNDTITGIVYGSSIFVGSYGGSYGGKSNYSTKPIKLNKLETRILQTQCPIGSMIRFKWNLNPFIYLGFGNWETYDTHTPYTYIRTA